MKSRVPENQPRSFRPVFALALGVSLVAVAILTLLPIGWTMNRLVVWLWFHGLDVWSWPAPLPRLFTLDRLAGVLNVLLTVPAAWLASMTWPRARCWWIAAAIISLCVAVELAQLLLPLGREATLSDVVTNGAGAVIGVALGWVTNRLVSSRSVRLNGAGDQLGG